MAADDDEERSGEPEDAAESGPSSGSAPESERRPARATRRDARSKGDGDKDAGNRAAEGRRRERPGAAKAKESDAARPATARPRRRRPSASATGDAASAARAAGEDKGATKDDAAAAEPAPATLSEERSARRFLGAGGILSAVGLVLVGTGPSETGGVVCVVGLLVLIYGIHTFGRLGPEPAK